MLDHLDQRRRLEGGRWQRPRSGVVHDLETAVTRAVMLPRVVDLFGGDIDANQRARAAGRVASEERAWATTDVEQAGIVGKGEHRPNAGKFLPVPGALD